MSEEQIFCTNHSQRETVLRCGKCERPFCSDCLVHTPVGLRCRQCANVGRSPVYVVPPAQVALALGAGLGAGVALGLALFALPILRAFALWLSPVYGIAVGEAVSAAANRKRGPVLQLVTVVSVLLGAILGKYGLGLLVVAGRAGGGTALMAAVEAIGSDIWLMLFIVVAVVVGQTRVR